MRLYYQALGALVSKQAAHKTLTAPPTSHSHYCSPQQISSNTKFWSTWHHWQRSQAPHCCSSHSGNLEASRLKTYSWLSAVWAPAPLHGISHLWPKSKGTQHRNT